MTSKAQVIWLIQYIKCEYYLGYIFCMVYSFGERVMMPHYSFITVTWNLILIYMSNATNGMSLKGKCAIYLIQRLWVSDGDNVFRRTDKSQTAAVTAHCESVGSALSASGNHITWPKRYRVNQTILMLNVATWYTIARYWVIHYFNG